MNDSPYLTTEQAASYLRLSPRTMEAWRASGRGPTYYKFEGGLVRYTKGDLDLYARRTAQPAA